MTLRDIVHCVFTKINQSLDEPLLGTAVSGSENSESERAVGQRQIAGLVVMATALAMASTAPLPRPRWERSCQTSAPTVD